MKRLKQIHEAPGAKIAFQKKKKSFSLDGKNRQKWQVGQNWLCNVSQNGGFSVILKDSIALLNVY